MTRQIPGLKTLIVSARGGDPMGESTTLANSPLENNTLYHDNLPRYKLYVFIRLYRYTLQCAWKSRINTLQTLSTIIMTYS